MGVTDLFMTGTKAGSRQDASRTDEDQPRISEFLTVQSLANFAAMTGAITAAWNGLQRIWSGASADWVPYAIAGGWAAISFLISIEGLTKTVDNSKPGLGTMLGALFVAAINALVLAGAVVGTDAITT